MNKKKLMSLIISAVIGSQLILGTYNSIYAVDIPKEITNNLSTDVKNLLDQLKDEENPTKIREIVKDNIFDRNMPIESIEQVMKQFTSVAIGSFSAPGYDQAKNFIISPLMNLLWPNGDNDYLWKAMKPEIQKMINNSIKDYDFGLKTQQISGIRSVFEDYASWLGDENKSQSEIQRKFSTLDSLFVQLLGELKSENAQGAHKLELLPLYTVTANFHLVVVSDMVRHAEARGYDTNTVNGYKNRLKERISEYTNYIDTVYKEGLAKRIQDSSSIQAINGAGASGDLNDRDGNHQKEMTAKKQWNYVNDYKRFMQLYVLDFAALWQYMDPDMYNKNVNFQISREIYTDIVGRQVGVTDKNNINFSRGSYEDGDYLGEFVGADIWSYNRIDRFTPLYNRGNVGKNYWPYSLGGSGGARLWLTGNGDVTETGLNNPNPITKVAASAEIVPWGLHFDHKTATGEQNFGSWRFGGNAPGAIKTTYYSYANNKLSSIHGLGIGNYPGGERNVSGLVFGFRPDTLTPANNLSENTISVFSSQKYLDKKGFSPQIEHILGGNAMKTSKQGDFMTYSLNSEKDGKYKIRLRVSSKTPSKLAVYVAGTKVGEINADATNTGVQGEYGKYQIVEGPEINLKAGANLVKIENANGGEFSVSNIELEHMREVPKLISIATVDHLPNVEIIEVTKSNGQSPVYDIKNKGFSVSKGSTLNITIKKTSTDTSLYRLMGTFGGSMMQLGNSISLSQGVNNIEVKIPTDGVLKNITLY
ncbi:insecticidal delta-endotoxin Cry8Ea1 family protein [Clostridium sp. Marseille-Q2269]|uniref:insecticidal delta-endotoxin Cry8Ea1 family protein n=1 Tax=Clostridium sp. Marseille-Q2269 TaxID=2942205 RepID=UPI0020737102|nr:insecticidal delta-endotoxin Cry8Ea1 family protein [Clostridium sp. Marseille-Q2269]